MIKDLSLTISGILFGELLVLTGELYYGLVIRLIVLLIIIIKIISKPFELETKIILHSLILLILLQAINLAMPRIFDNILLQYLLIYGLLIYPIYSMVRENGFYRKQLYYIFAAVLMGTITILFEYRMLTQDILYINGEITGIFLIILLSLKFLLSETKYKGNIINTCCIPLILLFIIFMVYKIKLYI